MCHVSGPVCHVFMSVSMLSRLCVISMSLHVSGLFWRVYCFHVQHVLFSFTLWRNVYLCQWCLPRCFHFPHYPSVHLSPRVSFCSLSGRLFMSCQVRSQGLIFSVVQVHARVRFSFLHVHISHIPDQFHFVISCSDCHSCLAAPSIGLV